METTVQLRVWVWHKRKDEGIGIFHLEKSKGRGMKERGKERRDKRAGFKSIPEEPLSEMWKSLTFYHSKNETLDLFVKITEAQNVPKY